MQLKSIYKAKKQHNLLPSLSVGSRRKETYEPQTEKEAVQEKIWPQSIKGHETYHAGTESGLYEGVKNAENESRYRKH